MLRIVMDGPPILSDVLQKAGGKDASILAPILAETVGFEPTCPSLDKTISSRSRYDHFDTSPYLIFKHRLARYLEKCKISMQDKRENF